MPVRCYSGPPWPALALQGFRGWARQHCRSSLSFSTAFVFVPRCITVAPFILSVHTISLQDSSRTFLLANSVFDKQHRNCLGSKAIEYCERNSNPYNSTSKCIVLVVADVRTCHRCQPYSPGIFGVDRLIERKTTGTKFYA